MGPGVSHALGTPGPPALGDQSALLNELLPTWGWKELKCFPGDSDGKESVCSVGCLDSIPGLGRSPGEGDSISGE